MSAHAPQCGLSDEEKEKFYDELVKVVSKFDENELILLGADLNGHVGVFAYGYEGVHGGMVFWDCKTCKVRGYWKLQIHWI